MQVDSILSLKTLKWFISLVFILGSMQFSVAQQKPVRIVFDVSSGDTLVHQAAMRHVSLMAKNYNDSQFEVVVYGNALPMVVTGKSTVGKQIQSLAANQNVTFRVCELTMKREQVDRSQIIQNVSPVPDAIIEIVTRQGEGWGYIKEAQ
jgi:uncharacterized protein